MSNFSKRKLLLVRDVHVLVNEQRSSSHAASLEQTGCWRRDKWSLTQNNMASAQPLLMSHLDLGTFLQYSCLQIRALTCTVEVFRDVGESDTVSNTPFKNREFKCSKHQAPCTEPSYSSGMSAGNGQIFSTSFFSSKIPASTDVSHTEVGRKKWLWIFSVLDTWLCEAEDLAIYLQSEETCSNTGSSATLQTLPWQRLALLDKQCSDSWPHWSCTSARDVQHHPLRKVTSCKLGSHLQCEISACWLCS